MSYLNPLRLHFAGRFQANVSTVNNDPAHFDNAIFQPGYQQMQGPGMQPPNGWFNPQGDAAWRFLGCRVTAAWTPAGAVPHHDPVWACIIADSDGRVPAKLVDLDSEQQLVSEIWGLQVRIADANGNTLMRGDFDPAAFTDIWTRATASGGSDVAAGAMYQSVLTNLQWSDVSQSPFLTALQQAATDGLLSIKFNVDGMNLDFTSAQFMTGRVVGTIGPATATEPRHLVIGRQFMASPAPTQSFFIPVGGINFFAAVVDPSASCIYLDLGNALSTGVPGGKPGKVGDLTLSYFSPIATPGHPAGTTIPLGVIPALGADGYTTDHWYDHTAGIVALPLNATQLQAIKAAPLFLTGNSGIVISEWGSGAFVRADRFVYRLSPGEQAQIPIYAMQWGLPLAGVELNFQFDDSQLQAQVGSGFPFIASSPPVAVPLEAVSFDPSLTTDAHGQVLLKLGVTDPGMPRQYIDGQVYGIRPSFADGQQYSGPDNDSNFISLLLWSGFTPASPVTWTDLQPIFQQYANLYPVMNRFLNLGDYNAVVANARLLSLAFGLNPADPNSMPVTRDLSPAKRTAILTWLQNPLPGPVVAKAPAPAQAASAPAAPAGPPPLLGGKAAAIARRLILQKR